MEIKCPRCKGSGNILHTDSSCSWMGVTNTHHTTCRQCNGSGMVNEIEVSRLVPVYEQCFTCKGNCTTTTKKRFMFFSWDSRKTCTECEGLGKKQVGEEKKIVKEYVPQ